jgi:hypothetical protein
MARAEQLSVHFWSCCSRKWVSAAPEGSLDKKVDHSCGEGGRGGWRWEGGRDCRWPQGREREVRGGEWKDGKGKRDPQLARRAEAWAATRLAVQNRQD